MQLNMIGLFTGGGTSDDEGYPRLPAPAKHKVVAGLGLVVFKALDLCMEDEEERHLHPELDKLLHELDERGSQHVEKDNEGIKRLSGDCDYNISNISLDQVIQCCRNQVAQPAKLHLRNVCHALVVGKALALSPFLDKVPNK